jgi:hypothetical protein
MYKSEVIDKDTVEKRIATRLIVLWKKKRKKLFHDRIIIEEGGGILSTPIGVVVLGTRVGIAGATTPRTVVSGYRCTALLSARDLTSYSLLQRHLWLSL